jgi:hypothetical protein
LQVTCGRVALALVLPEPRQAGGHAQVKSLPTRRGEEREQRLADLLMDKGVVRLAAGGDVLNQRGASRLIERVEQVVLVDALETGEQVEAEGPRRRTACPPRGDDGTPLPRRTDCLRSPRRRAPRAAARVCRPHGTLHELGNAVEQVAALLLGRQRDGLRNVRVARAQLGHELGDLGGVLAEGLAERLGRHLACGLFDVFDGGQIRRRALLVDAVAGQHAQALW